MNRQKTARKTNLATASREWATRPADQRFWTLQELLEKAKKYAEESYTHSVKLSDCEVVPVGEDLVIDIGASDPATFQNYSFGQVCNIAKAPAGYLRELPAGLAAQNLNHGLQRLETGEQMLMLHKNGDHVLRCVTGNEYGRIWNWQIADMALALEESEGWKVPPARPCGLANVPIRRATEADVLKRASHPSLGIDVGDEISPAGLYCSDHDSFIFQINEDNPIDAGNGEILYRGVIWKNSEVGDARFVGTMFLFDSVCGNHIIWGARICAEITIIHRKNAPLEFLPAMAQATNLVLAPASEDEDRIKAAKMFELGPGRTEVVDTVFKKFTGQLSRVDANNAYTLAERHAEEHGTEPNTAWGYAAGLTRLSQGLFADKRDAMDRIGGRILEMAKVRS